MAKPRRPAADLDDDAQLFERAMSGVKRLPADTRRKIMPRPESKPPPRAPAVDTGGSFTVGEVGESVTGVADGVNRRVLKELRAGDYPVESQLDMHGLSRDAAAAALERFLARARAGAQRCVLVIHGRGLSSGPEGPVLKAAMQQWLSAGKSRRHVLAFTTAPPAMGGAGALLVLLRRHPS
mgnify:CR=1 FL=1